MTMLSLDGNVKVFSLSPSLSNVYQFGEDVESYIFCKTAFCNLPCCECIVGVTLRDRSNQTLNVF